ncbi:hypothetical protein AMELA_G00232650 [Ameiurus melas]|uniref:RRM domain-containing protein n=1 Tax=Ameiurus melas TaxID=219545 RepID=A0A7J5ZXY6_AMEME|nr:hypothetical protein AMELA_G00232650 [Ameiurus melas]
MFKSQKILHFVRAANPAHPTQPPHFYPQSHPIQPPHFYHQSHPNQPPSSHSIMPPHFYPTPSMMEMKPHHSSIPSVQLPQYTWPLLARKEHTLCEDEGIQPGSIITPQTLDIDEIVKSIREEFIKSLDYSVDNKRLHKEFLPFGAVISAKVVMENGRSKGFGYISYSSTNEAMEAIKGMNGEMLDRRPIHVALSNRREECKPQLTWTEQKTESSQPTNPWQSQHKNTQRVQLQPSHTSKGNHGHQSWCGSSDRVVLQGRHVLG